MAVEAVELLNLDERNGQVPVSVIEFHEAANVFPLMEGNGFLALVEDIRQNGLIEPIWTYQAKIVDGRNRYRACLEAGVEPVFQEWSGTGTLAAFVVSKNLTRRHLSESQRSMIAAKLANMRQGRPSEKVPIGTFSQNDMATLLNVSERSVKRANKVLRAGTSELINAVDNDKIAVAAAANLVDRPPEYQQAVVAKIASGEAKGVVDARRLLKREEAKIAPAMDGKYKVIYADPPWNYGDKRDGHTTGAEDHYPSMTIQELCELPVKDLAEENAVLYLWVTSPLLEECFDVIRAWGFKYKTSFVWDKVKHNMGHYNSVRHELLLVCTRGSCLPDNPKLYDSVVSIERTDKHSEKPEEFRKIIDDLYTTGNRIELFARKAPTNWTVWGNEISVAKDA